MRISIILYSLFISLLFTNFGCKSTKLIRPAERYIDMKEQGISTVHLPILINKNDIEVSINELIVGVIYEDTNIDDDDLMVKAEKSEAITVEIGDASFSYRVPLDIWVKKDIGLTNVEARGEIAIELSTAYEIGTDWQLKTTTEVLRYKWLKKPKIKVGFIDIPIKFIGDKVMEKSHSIISKSLDEQLANLFDLRTYVQQGWDVLQQPILVSEEYNLWVKIIPENLSMMPLEVNGDAIKGKVQIEAKTSATIGEAPALHSSIPLPDFKFSEIEGDDFLVQLETTISYKEAEKLAKQNLVGQTYHSGRRSVTIQDIELFGQDDKLVINVGLTGSYNGSVYMLGRPVYNIKKNRIEFENLDFELRTKDVLMKSLGWLFRKGLEKQFRNAMKFPLEENLNEMKSLIQNTLNEYKVTDQVIINGDLEDIEIHKTHLSKDFIHVLFLSKGQLNVKIKEYRK